MYLHSTRVRLHKIYAIHKNRTEIVPNILGHVWLWVEWGGGFPGWRNGPHLRGGMRNDAFIEQRNAVSDYQSGSGIWNSTGRAFGMKLDFRAEFGVENYTRRRNERTITDWNDILAKFTWKNLHEINSSVNYAITPKNPMVRTSECWTRFQN